MKVREIRSLTCSNEGDSVIHFFTLLTLSTEPIPKKRLYTLNILTTHECFN